MSVVARYKGDGDQPWELKLDTKDMQELVAALKEVRDKSNAHLTQMIGVHEKQAPDASSEKGDDEAEDEDNDEDDDEQAS